MHGTGPSYGPAGPRSPHGPVCPPARRLEVARRSSVSSSRRLLPRNTAAVPIADTVERLQGMTVDLIVVGATAADPGYVSAIGGFLFSVNRLNVSVSPARCKAIVLGSPGLWNAVPTTLGAPEGQRVWGRFRAVEKKLRQNRTPGSRLDDAGDHDGFDGPFPSDPGRTTPWRCRDLPVGGAIGRLTFSPATCAISARS